MIIKRYIKGITFILLMLSVISIAMAAAPNIVIVINSPTNNSFVNGTYTLKATVSDTNNITSVKFLFLNKSAWEEIESFSASDCPSLPCTLTHPWNTTKIPNDAYKFNVTVIDDNATNNIKSNTTVNFIINNAPAQTELYNFTMNVNTGTQNTTPNTNATYILTINHTGSNETDVVNLAVNNKKNAKIANLSSTSITLKKGVPKTVFLNVTNTTEGSFEVSVSAISAGNNNRTKSVSTTTNVKSPFNLNLIVNPLNRTVPPGTNATYTLTLKNTGSETDSYNFTVGKDNDSIPANLSDDIINLGPGNSTTIFLNVSSSEGTYIVNVTAGSMNNTNKTARVSTKTEVKSIYDPELNITPVYRQVSPKENATFNIEIVNKGNLDDVFNITTNDTSSRAILSKGNISLEPAKSGSLSMNFSSSTSGRFTIRVKATSQGNFSISETKDVTIFIPPKTFFKGNRIWDGSKPNEYSLNYTWDPMSFYAFYYDLNSNVGTESLEIKLDSRDDRNVQEGTLKYSTKPQNVRFKYGSWGNYRVVGFMAEKYFAGYTAGSKGITDKAISTIGSKQLHKVLMDDDTKRTIYAGSTLTLSEGYVLKIKDVDITGGKIVLLSLLKDGGEVDTATVSAGGTYVYTKRIGSVSDVPVIAVHIDTVFSGKEANAAFLRGIFQISESYTSVNSGNRYGIMEITGVSDTGISMENKNSLTLSAGSINDVMGDIKIIVADNSSVLRFAPMVKKSGTYEVRGTISQNEAKSEWNPMNFEGFYYNLDEDVGSEKLSVNRTDRTIGEDNLIYTSTPQSVSFKYKKFGTYDVIGFMAEKYFAGYNSGTVDDITSTPISTINSKQLHKILIDDDTQRTVYAGSTLTLNDGYVLKIKDVDITGGKTVLLSLLKDGNEIDTTAVPQGSTYKFTRRAGSVSDLPVIVAHVDVVFAGKEATAAFLKGIFQISENYTTINTGDRFGIMEVSGVSDTKIEMKNPSSVTLSSASTVDVMGNIKFKVADSGVVRFYPFITVNGSVVAANKLVIDAPTDPMVTDTITITVTASGTPVEGAEVVFDNSTIGTTNSTGRLNYTLIRSGLHTITATKLGYEKSVKTIQVSEYVDTRLSIEVPAVIDQGIPVSIKVLSNGTAISGANVTFDNEVIGTTDTSGILNYTFNVSGTHNLGASKDKYISVVREISIRMPFSEYKALDINITPAVIFTDQQFVVRSNITNAGTKADTLPVALIINNTVVDNRNVTLAPGEINEINFTRKENLPPGNYTVEILEQKQILEVKEEPTNYLLIGGVLTGIGAIVIYLLTARNRINLETIRNSLNIEEIRRKL